VRTAEVHPVRGCSLPRVRTSFAVRDAPPEAASGGSRLARTIQLRSGATPHRSAVEVTLSHSKTDTRGAKQKRQKGGKPQGGKPHGGKPHGARVRGAGKGSRKEMPYFLGPVQGGTGVFRRPVGNRAEPTNCGVMPNRKLADALVAQLKRAESVVSDLFLEATDDGIEALEAVLAACRDAVLKQSEPRQPRHSRPVRAVEGAEGSAPEDSRRPRRGRGRRRGRGPRGDGPPGGAPAPDAG
jgi:hypothetical protein